MVEDTVEKAARISVLVSVSRGERKVTISALRCGRSSDRADLDSHADTCVGGANCVLLKPSGEMATVSTFSDERKPFGSIPIGTVAMAWTNPATGERLVLVIHEALYFGDRLHHTLICPNQVRANGIVVNDTPRQFDKASMHSMLVSIESNESLEIPLVLDGVISHVPDVVKPTDDELLNCRRIELTSESEWKPYDKSFAATEAVLEERAKSVAAVERNDQVRTDVTDGDGHESRTDGPGRTDEPEVGTDETGDEDDDRRTAVWGPVFPDPIELGDRDDFAERLIAAVSVAPDDVVGDGLEGHSNAVIYPDGDHDRHVFALSTEEKRSVVTKEILARRWGIGLSAAARTLKMTTQKGLRSFVHPTDH